MRVNSESVALNLRAVKGIPWIWAAVGALVMWVALGFFAQNLNLESLIATSTNASFLAIVALGQMLVITTGGGAIDLSIPNVITLSAFLSAGIASGSNLKALYAVPVVLLIGAFIALVNALTVLFLRIPPIIATLGTGYIITTAILIYNPYFTTAYVAPVLLHIARDRLFGVVPLVLLITIGIVILLSLMPALVGSDLRADRGLGSLTSPTGSPSEVPPSHEGNRHKRTQRSPREDGHRGEASIWVELDCQKIGPWSL